MKLTLLAMLLPILIVSCKSTSTPSVDKTKEFSKLLEAEFGIDAPWVKRDTQVPGYSVYLDKRTNTYVAYNLSKYDPATMKTMSDYLASGVINGTDIVSNLKVEVEWHHEAYWQDDYANNTYTETYYDYECSCDRTNTWTENVWVGRHWVEYDYTVDFYNGGGFRFSNTDTLPKDFETLRALGEQESLKLLSNQLASKLSLSTDRSQELAQIYYKWKKVESKRELTESEKSYLMTDALGVSFKQAEGAIAEKIIGNDKPYEQMLNLAAEKNRTTPEKIGAFLNEMVLED